MESEQNTYFKALTMSITDTDLSNKKLSLELSATPRLGSSVSSNASTMVPISDLLRIKIKMSAGLAPLSNSVLISSNIWLAICWVTNWYLADCWASLSSFLTLPGA